MDNYLLGIGFSLVVLGCGGIENGAISIGFALTVIGMAMMFFSFPENRDIYRLKRNYRRIMSHLV